MSLDSLLGMVGSEPIIHHQDVMPIAGASASHAMIMPLPSIALDRDLSASESTGKRKFSQIGRSTADLEEGEVEEDDDDAEALGFTISSGGGSAAAEAPKAKRARKKENHVDFKDTIALRKITELATKDEIIDFSAATNFDERTGMISGPCYLRADGRSIDWRLERSLEEHTLQVKILGSCVDFESLFQAAYPDNQVHKKTLAVSYQQEYFAIYNEFFDLFNPLVGTGHISKKEVKSLTNLVTFHLTNILVEQDSLKEEEKILTISALRPKLLKSITPISKHTISKEAFIDLITHHDETFEEGKALKKELLDEAQVTHKSASGVIDHAKVVEVFSHGVVDLKSSKNPIIDPEDALDAGVPLDVYLAEEFEDYVADISSGEWDDDEERELTIVHIADESMETFIEVINFFFNQKNTHAYFFGTRGISP